MWMDGIEVWSVVCSGTALTRQHFFQVVYWLPWGFIGCRKFWQAFFKFFSDVFLPGIQISEARIQDGWNVAARYRCAPKVTILLPIAFAAETNPRGMLNISRW
jgi:hypothetical protein